MLIPPTPFNARSAVDDGDPECFDPGRLAEPPTPEIVVVDAGCLWPGIRDHWATCLVRAAGDADLELSLEEAREWVNDAPRDRLVRALARQTHLGPEVLQPLLAAIWQDFEELAAADRGVGPGTDVAPGAADALAALQAEGCRVLIKGPVPRALLEARVDQLDWRRTGLVDGCLGAEDGVASGPPSASMALQRLGLRPIGWAARVVASTVAAERASEGDFSWVICLGCPAPSVAGEVVPVAQVAANFGEMLAALLARELQ